MSRFEGQAAVVTGGAQGIGRRVAEQLHAEGASVLMVDVGADLAAHGVRVNGVDPGLVRTRLTRYVTETPVHAADYLQRIPPGRFGEPADISEAICFLASDGAAWITGERICMDGGQTPGTPLPLPDTALLGSHRAASRV